MLGDISIADDRRGKRDESPSDSPSCNLARILIERFSASHSGPSTMGVIAFALPFCFRELRLRFRPDGSWPCGAYSGGSGAVSGTPARPSWPVG